MEHKRIRIYQEISMVGKMFSMSSFHNTIDARNEELKELELRAETQEGKVLKYFKYYSDKTELTPSDVWKSSMFCYQAPITSIRRAFSNLSNTNPPKLEKTGNKRKGIYGVNENCWRLADKSNQFKMEF